MDTSSPPAANTFSDLDPRPSLLMGPGPVNVHPRVLRAMSMPMLGQFDPQFTQYMDETMALVRQIFRTENEWSFRADILWDAWGLLTAKSQGGWFPFEITLRVISDSVAAIIYIVFLGAQIALWMQWQKRGEKAKKTAAVVSSTYGRPLVKRG